MGRCINRCIVTLLPSRAAHFNIQQLLLCIIMHICQTLSRVCENALTELQSRWAVGWLCCSLHCQRVFSDLYCSCSASDLYFPLQEAQGTPVTLRVPDVIPAEISDSLNPWVQGPGELQFLRWWAPAGKDLGPLGQILPPARAIATLTKEMRLPGCGWRQNLAIFDAWSDSRMRSRTGLFPPATPLMLVLSKAA